MSEIWPRHLLDIHFIIGLQNVLRNPDASYIKGNCCISSTQLTWDTWECLESCRCCGPVCLAVFLWGRREDRERATQREGSGSCTRLTDVNVINWAELLSAVISVFTSPHVLQCWALTSSHTHTHTYTEA